MPESSTPTSFDQALREHEALRKDIAELRESLLLPRPGVGETGYHTWATKLSEWVFRLHDKVFRHFRAEEREGLLDELAMRHPHACSRIDELEKEHGEILAGFREVMAAGLAYSAGKKPDNPRLRKAMGDLLDRLAKHEKDETALMTDIEYDDLGTGD